MIKEQTISGLQIKQDNYEKKHSNYIQLGGFILTPINHNYSKKYKENRLYFIIATYKENKFYGLNSMKFDSFIVYCGEKEDVDFYNEIVKTFKKDDLVFIEGMLVNDLVINNEKRNEFFQPTIAFKTLNLFQPKILLKSIMKSHKTAEYKEKEKRFRQQYEYQLRGYDVKFSNDAFNKDKFGIDISDGLSEIIK